MTLKSNCCKFIASTFMRVLSYNRFITEQPDFLFYSQSIILNLTVLLINNLYLNLCWKVEQVQWHKELGNQNTYFFAYFPNPIPRLLFFFNERVTKLFPCIIAIRLQIQFLQKSTCKFLTFNYETLLNHLDIIKREVLFSFLLNCTRR